MSSPTASAPIAVLVLAWDETIPAVRALVEAPELSATALDSVVVLVPAGPANEELTPEEFLPLVDSTSPTEILPDDVATAPSSPASSVAALEVNSLPPSTTTSVASANPSGSAVSSLAIETASLAALPAVELEKSIGLPLVVPPVPSLANQGIPTVATPGWPTVQVLRLSGYSLSALAAHTQQPLPGLVWEGNFSSPTAPYVGSSLATLVPPNSSIGPAATVADFVMTAAPTQAATLPTTEHRKTLALSEAPTLLAYPSAELPAAPDAEADTSPEVSLLEPVATIEASTTELSEAAADEPADSVATAPASWPENLALPPPAAVDKPINEENALTIGSPSAETAPMALAIAELATQPNHAVLLPTASSFDAPNLNFQIIQYARLAVPLALAHEPFAVLYAPAWPTWLAAQELRHRTGHPLVLHVATLAAAETEPLDLAAGWPAEIQRQALHRADLILTETPALAYRLRRELNLPAYRVRPVPAADTAAVAQALSTAQVW